MVHRESIGKVVGENGKTYKPQLVNNGDGTFRFDFEIATEGTEGINDITSQENIQIPFMYPRKDEKGNLIFTYTTVKNFENNDGIPSVTIPNKDIKGNQGEPGALKVSMVVSKDYLKQNLSNLKTDTVYIVINQDNNSDTSNNEENNILDGTEAYIVYATKNDNGTESRKLIAIESLVNLTNYCTTDEMESHVNSEIASQIGDILSQQQAIFNVLNNGIEIDDSPAVPIDSVVNVMSETAVEALKEELYNALAEYIKESDIVFDAESGEITIH